MSVEINGGCENCGRYTYVELDIRSDVSPILICQKCSINKISSDRDKKIKKILKRKWWKFWK